MVKYDQKLGVLGWKTISPLDLPAISVNQHNYLLIHRPIQFIIGGVPQAGGTGIPWGVGGNIKHGGDR